ncbi:MAG: transcriptional regulator NrdR [Nanoarchaeota archaeon]
MKCPYCHQGDTKVLDSRENEDQTVTRRRRECLKCEKRFTTYERLETSNILVIKKDGRREMYDRQKIKSGIVKSCQKRPVTMEQIEKALDDIESDIITSGDSEIESRKIGDQVMRQLKKLDKVAYIRFASVYREFEDLEMFKEELNKLLKK